jgi:hypothetical protein
MSPSVSVPEKALEHWSSMYVTYRYRSNVALWWPASGEDIDFGWLPRKPGKAVQLELKTTTVAGAWRHDVRVDLGQLWEYLQRPLGHQPFYAFPKPEWDGYLTAVADANGRPVTELGFARSGARWWFADWMVLLTAEEVAAVLRQELAAHGSADRDTRKRLVRFDLRNSTGSPAVTWGSSGVTASTVGWRQFWSELEECGRPRWPQLIRLPERVARTRGPYLPSQVAWLLREAANTAADSRWDDEPFVTLVPDAHGNFQIAAVPAADYGEPDQGRSDPLADSESSQRDDPSADEDGAGEASQHRLVVFIEAQALFGGRSRPRRG